MQIRLERPTDTDAIRLVTEAAFKIAPHNDQSEASIIDVLRREGALTVSLVALETDEIVGHVAFSPVAINRTMNGWYGLAPVSVRPEMQKKGIGQALIREGLLRLRSIKAAGCVVLGEPSYYARFGFASDPDLYYGDAPREYFQRLIFNGAPPKGEVKYHAGFSAL